MTPAELTALDCAVAEKLGYKPFIMAGRCSVNEHDEATGYSTPRVFQPHRDYDLVFRLAAERELDVSWDKSEDAVTVSNDQWNGRQWLHKGTYLEFYEEHANADNPKAQAAAVAICRAIAECPQEVTD